MDEILKATHQGELELNGIELPCYVLTDGSRVLSGRGMQSALELGQSRGQKIQQLASNKSIKPLIDNELELGIFQPIVFETPFKLKANGYEATVLVDLCNVLLEARKKKVLPKPYKEVADRAEILIRSFAKTGIIALVDEATGYQYDREKDALQKIMKAIVSDEILTYQKQFHLSFYKEIYRLWGIPFTEKNIKKKPQFIGHLTNKYVYSNFPAGTIVLQKLKSKTPRTKGGNRKYKFHQSLTKDKGREILKKTLYTVEALASISKNKKQFNRLIKEKYGEPELPFPNMDELWDDQPKNKQTQLSDFNKSLKQAIEHKPDK